MIWRVAVALLVLALLAAIVFVAPFDLSHG